MNQQRQRHRWLAPSLAVLLLIGCSGSDQNDQTAGVSNGGTGGIGSVATGTVTGFGSIVVDGKAWDDRSAAVSVETDPRLAPVRAQVRLGQRVAVGFEVDGSAQTVTIDAAVIAPVTQASAGELLVAGQRIRVNSDATRGPMTVYENVTGAAAIVIGDLVEVHGTSVFDPASNGYVIQASRIERLTALAAGLVRVSGVVQDLAADGKTFHLGELSVTLSGPTQIQPAGRTLAAGQSVVIWSSASALTAGSLAADVVRIKQRPEVGSPAYLAGVIAKLDIANSTFDLGGVTVDAKSATVSPSTASLSVGRYVVVQGSFAANGSFTAANINLRRDGLDPEVEIRGTITNFVSLSNFLVRSTVIDASTATLDVASCQASGANLANGVFVSLEGTIAGTTVRATKIRCDVAQPGAVIEVSGQLGSLNSTARTFTLTSKARGGTAVVQVRWTDLTYFGASLSAAQLLNGAQVEVEGFMDAGVLVARRISPE